MALVFRQTKRTSAAVNAKSDGPKIFSNTASPVPWQS